MNQLRIFTLRKRITPSRGPVNFKLFIFCFCPGSDALSGAGRLYCRSFKHVSTDEAVHPPLRGACH